MAERFGQHPSDFWERTTPEMAQLLEDYEMVRQAEEAADLEALTMARLA